MIDLTRRGFLGTVLAVPVFATLPAPIIKAASFVYEPPDIIKSEPLVGRILDARFELDWLGDGREGPPYEMVQCGLSTINGEPVILSTCDSSHPMVWRPDLDMALYATKTAPIIAFVQRPKDRQLRGLISVLFEDENGTLMQMGEWGKLPVFAT